MQTSRVGHGLGHRANRPLRLEPLEPRVLLSAADGYPIIALGGGDADATAELLDARSFADHAISFRVNLACNQQAAITTKTVKLQPGNDLGLDLTGRGVTVGIWDTGAVRDTHEQFDGRVDIIDDVYVSDHSTHVAGTIGSSGEGSADAELNRAAKGMASRVEIRSRDIDDDYTEMQADADVLELSNHSYGLYRGWHTSRSLGGMAGVETSIWMGDPDLNDEDPYFGKYAIEHNPVDQCFYEATDLPMLPWQIDQVA